MFFSLYIMPCTFLFRDRTSLLLVCAFCSIKSLNMYLTTNINIGVECCNEEFLHLFFLFQFGFQFYFALRESVILLLNSHDSLYQPIPHVGQLLYSRVFVFLFFSQMWCLSFKRITYLFSFLYNYLLYLLSSKVYYYIKHNVDWRGRDDLPSYVFATTRLWKGT